MISENRNQPISGGVFLTQRLFQNSSLSQFTIQLLPIIAEITLWSDKNVRELNPIMVKDDYNFVRNNKKTFLDGIKKSYLSSIS
jgi:hypothetical protein